MSADWLLHTPWSDIITSFVCLIKNKINIDLSNFNNLTWQCRIKTYLTVFHIKLPDALFRKHQLMLWNGIHGNYKRLTDYDNCVEAFHQIISFLLHNPHNQWYHLLAIKYPSTLCLVGLEATFYVILSILYFSWINASSCEADFSQ